MKWTCSIETEYIDVTSFGDTHVKKIPTIERKSVVCSFSKDEVLPNALLKEYSFNSSCGNTVEVEDIITDPAFPYVGNSIITSVEDSFNGETTVRLKSVEEWVDRKVFGGQKAKVSLKG